MVTAPQDAPEWPADWPGEGPIDLDIHDLPHKSATTEWWYINSHLNTIDGRTISLFAAFFRVAKGRDPVTKQVLYAHSLTWALSDVDNQRYHFESRVDRDAPKMGLEKLERGDGTSDQRLRRAMREVLERGSVPYPDRMFDGEVFVNERRLELDYDRARFRKREDGTYSLELHHPDKKVGCKLVIERLVEPVRHGDNGVVKGADGADMFYYFVPSCKVTGTLTLDGARTPLTEGQGWYDHEFGGFKPGDEENLKTDYAWNWMAAQLDDGRQLSAYELVDLEASENSSQRIVFVDSDGGRHEATELELEPTNSWRSTRTFNEYPTRFKLRVPTLELELTIEASFDDQEFITLISKPAFWEGRCEVYGTWGEEPVRGRGYLERSGFLTVDSLDDFFGAVSKEVRKSVNALIPFDPSFEQVRDLVTTEEREHFMEGVNLETFVDTMIRPVREITDRGGKSWRSYAALACCDIVGGDSRQYVQWLAMPELMHVGSLIVDDFQDQSDVRRGGPTVHKLYGEPLAVNAGTACYFMGQQLLAGPELSPADKLRIYDYYFEALRAGHAGQAFDLGGFDDAVEEAVESGEGASLEQRVLAIHRLKTAAPASALARMGAVAGGGTEEQIELMGVFFESVGLAFQIVDDVLNLRGFRDDLKRRGEDIAHGKVTLPVAKALGSLPLADRRWLWDTIREKPQQRQVIESVITKLEECGAIDACEKQAHQLVEDAWAELDPVTEDSLPKLMLRAFGWYVLERHY